MMQLLRYNMQMSNAIENTLLMAQLSSLSGESAHTHVRASHVSDIMQYGFAAVSLLLLAPLFLIIGLLIRLTSQGPVLYRGLRVGKNGRTFTIYEFSILCTDAEAKIGAGLLINRDASYTCIGKWLQCTKLDRLPQLVNVLKGEMNLLGPQPVRPIFLEKLCGDTPRYPIRFTVKPGMTDVAPMGNRYCINAKDTLRDELRDIKNRSLLLALKFICPTHPSPDTPGICERGNNYATWQWTRAFRRGADIPGG
jgi:lipopolysaccharide/colanic/teichoic acid biosynthesis glycosyltransferase